MARRRHYRGFGSTAEAHHKRGAFAVSQTRHFARMASYYARKGECMHALDSYGLAAEWYGQSYAEAKGKRDARKAPRYRRGRGMTTMNRIKTSIKKCFIQQSGASMVRGMRYAKR